MMHSKFHPRLELLHLFAHHRQHYPTTTNIFGLTNVESCCVCIIGNVFCCVIKLDIRKAATLGVSASGCLMEVGRSIEVCHKLAYSLAQTSLFWKRRAAKEALLVHNQSSTSISDCIPSSYLWNEAELGVSSAWRPLYKGDNSGRALTHDWDGQEVVAAWIDIWFPCILFFNYFVWRLIGGSTVLPYLLSACLIRRNWSEK